MKKLYSDKLNGFWEEGYHYYLEFRNKKLAVPAEAVDSAANVMTPLTDSTTLLSECDIKSK